MLAPWKKNYDQTRQNTKKQRHYFVDKGLSSQSYGFSSSHVWMWELECKESWVLKNWCFWTLVLKTLESPLDCKETQPVNLKENQSWIFTGRTEVDAEASIIWPLDTKSWLTGKDPDAGQDGRQEEKGMASLTQWTWVWASTGKPGVVQSMGLQRVRQNWVTELKLYMSDLSVNGHIC